MLSSVVAADYARRNTVQLFGYRLGTADFRETNVDNGKRVVGIAYAHQRMSADFSLDKWSNPPNTPAVNSTLLRELMKIRSRYTGLNLNNVSSVPGKVKPADRPGTSQHQNDAKSTATADRNHVTTTKSKSHTLCENIDLDKLRPVRSLRSLWMAANGGQETDTSSRGHLSPTASDAAHVSPTASDAANVSPTTPARRTSAAQINMQSDRAPVDVNNTSAPQSSRNAQTAPLLNRHLHEDRPDDGWLSSRLGSANETANYGYIERNVQEYYTDEFGHRYGHEEQEVHYRVASGNRYSNEVHYRAASVHRYSNEGQEVHYRVASGHQHSHGEAGEHYRAVFACMFEGTNCSVPSVLTTLTTIATCCYRLMTLQ